ncbi:hypothetical protein [Burkholderia multivorans]|uniref:hypothetical protein n=1 Tax=Burkholderia multivorans TaxID=87883 RepID=UPI002ED4365C
MLFQFPHDTVAGNDPAMSRRQSDSIDDDWGPVLAAARNARMTGGTVRPPSDRHAGYCHGSAAGSERIVIPTMQRSCLATNLCRSGFHPRDGATARRASRSAESMRRLG